MCAHRRHQMRHQIMRQRSLFCHLAHEHRDRASDRLIDVNNKNFVAIPNENRAAAAGWEHSTNMYLNDRFVHRVDGTDGRTKNKLLPATPRRAPRPCRTHAPAPIGPMCPIRPIAHRPAKRRRALSKYTAETASNLLLFFLNRPCMFRGINNCPLCSR